MARLEWDKSGSRFFETGLDRGVLYTTTGIGVAWNGLLSVTESPNASETRSFFLDGVKYLEIPGKDDFGGSIEAFTYPAEFGVHDGTAEYASGLYVGQQRRKPFSLAYRTKQGNDVVGADHGYKLHIVYNALARPSDHQYSTMGDSTEPLKMSWDFSTTPRKPTGIPVAPLSHLVIDSNKVDPNLLRFIEERLYGTDRSGPELLPMEQIFALFANPAFVFAIVDNPGTGLNKLILQASTGDLIGRTSEGLYQILSESRLVPTGVDGFSRLEK